MLQFDFRNGPLRRKYDGLKYSLKNIEDIYYELSLQNAHNLDLSLSEEPEAKKQRSSKTESDSLTSSISSPFDSSELDQIRERLELYDKFREVRLDITLL